MIPFVILQLDKAYNLRFGMRTMLELKKEGLDVSKKFDPSIDNMLKVLWVMLRRENSALTIEMVADLVDDNANNLEEVFAKVAEAMEVAQDTGELKKGRNKKN